MKYNITTTIRQSKANNIDGVEQNFYLMHSLEKTLVKAMEQRDDELFWKTEKELSEVYIRCNKVLT